MECNEVIEIVDIFPKTGKWSKKGLICFQEPKNRQNVTV